MHMMFLKNELETSDSLSSKSTIYVPDGGQAWEIISKCEHNFKLIIIDYNMPVIHGLDLAKKIKAFYAEKKKSSAKAVNDFGHRWHPLQVYC